MLPAITPQRRPSPKHSNLQPTRRLRLRLQSAGGALEGEVVDKLISDQNSRGGRQSVTADVQSSQRLSGASGWWRVMSLTPTWEGKEKKQTPNIASSGRASRWHHCRPYAQTQLTRQQDVSRVEQLRQVRRSANMKEVTDFH